MTKTLLPVTTVPIRVEGRSLDTGMVTVSAVSTSTGTRYQVDEILKERIPSNACHGRHFLTERGAMVCYAPCSRNLVVIP